MWLYLSSFLLLWQNACCERPRRRKGLFCSCLQGSHSIMMEKAWWSSVYRGGQKAEQSDNRKGLGQGIARLHVLYPSKPPWKWIYWKWTTQVFRNHSLRQPWQNIQDRIWTRILHVRHPHLRSLNLTTLEIKDCYFNTLYFPRWFVTQWEIANI